MSDNQQADRYWREQWECFKQELPHQNDPYSSRNWGNNLHSLCSFPGKLKPAIAHHLVQVFVPKGGEVLDPFSGVGTIPLEAALQSRKSYAFDLSPHAYVITKAKLEITSATDADLVIQELEQFIGANEPSEESYEVARSFGLNGNITEYYHEDTLKEILLAREWFHREPITEHSPSKSLVMASLLHILHGNRPYALSRRSHPITPYAPSGEFEYRPLIPRLEDKVSRSFQSVSEYTRNGVQNELTNFQDEGESQQEANTFVEGDTVLLDSTKWWPPRIDNLDAVITSPPFFDSTRFYSQNWLRLWFAGWEPEDFDTKPSEFVDKRQKESFEVYERLIRQSRERLKSDGVLVFHLGKSDQCDMADEILKVAKPWFDDHDLLDESVVHLEKHGVEDKGSTTDHLYLVLF